MNILWPRLRRFRWLIVTGFVVVAAGLCTVAWWANTESETALPQTARMSHQQFDGQVTKMSNMLRAEGPDKLFAYVTNQSQSDQAFARDCHPMMHMLGKTAYDQYGGFAEAMKRQNELCNSGFTHGIIEAHYANVPDIRQAIATTCPADASQDFRQWQCYHGIGHGVMSAEKRDVQASVADCRQLTTGFATDSCVNGVYMEHFNVVDHSGNLRPGSTDGDLFSQCRQADSKYKRDCYYYAPSAYLAQYPNAYQQAYGQCMSGAAGFRVECVSGVGGQLMKDNIIDPTFVDRQCSRFDKRYQEVCIQAAVSIYVNHFAATAPASLLCAAEFKAYQQACQAIVASKRQQFNI